jgi:Flp pilus assembly pilin Flp
LYAEVRPTSSRGSQVMSLKNIKTRIARFHNDEDGLEAVQVVMIVAIAAIILVAVMTLGQEVFDWLREKWNELRGESIS